MIKNIMNKFREKLAIFLLAMFLAGSVPVSAGEVADEVRNIDPASGGKLSLIRCIQKGGIDFSLFWDAIIFSDDFTEGVIEPWNDVLFRNQCHSNDVMGLINQQDKLRKSIRDAFLTCNTQKLPRLRKSFAKTLAEIYYVRHVVDGSLVLSLPFDILSTKSISDATELDRNILYSEMLTKYVGSDFLTLDEFNILFRNLEFKYRDRKKTYILCDKGSWQDVTKKWKEFVDSKGGLEPAFEDFKKNIANKGKKLGKEFATIKTVELFTEDSSFTDYISSFAQMNLNNMEPQKGYEDIRKSLIKNLPTAATPSQTDLLGAIAVSGRQFEIETMKTEMKSNFKILYKDAGDETIESFLNNLDGRSLAGTTGLLEIIENSLPEMNKILRGTETMNDRQCPASA